MIAIFGTLARVILFYILAAIASAIALWLFGTTEFAWPPVPGASPEELAAFTA